MPSFDAPALPEEKTTPNNHQVAVSNTGKTNVSWDLSWQKNEEITIPPPPPEKSIGNRLKPSRGPGPSDPQGRVGNLAPPDQSNKEENLLTGRKPSVNQAPPLDVRPSDSHEEEEVPREKIKALIARLLDNHTGPQFRIGAANELGTLGPKATSASRALCQALLDPNPAVGKRAAAALEKVNPIIYEVVIPVIVDEKIQVRAEAIEKIGKLGPEGKPAVPVLIRFAEKVARKPLVIHALAATASDEKWVTQLFVGWLKDADPTVREAVAADLPRMEQGQLGIPNLVFALRLDRAEAVKVAAAKSLGEFGPIAKEALAALEAARLSGSEPLRQASRDALVRIKSQMP